jgi:glyoxylase-like metal-dependent hydrolase (beta-lactamase superfamily II)
MDEVAVAALRFRLRRRPKVIDSRHDRGRGGIASAQRIGIMDTNGRNNIMQTSLRIALAALAVAALTPQYLAAQAPPPPPLVKPNELRQVSAHVQIIPDESVPLVPNVGYVVGDKAVLVIDTGLGPRNGAAVAEIAQKLAGGSREIYLVPTHVHPEHDLGAQAFPATTKLIRSEDQQKDIAEFGLQVAQVFAARGPILADLLKGAEFRKPDITYTKDYDLDLGGVRAHLMTLGPNHTRGDTAIWIEPDRVLFGGDVAMKAQPLFASPYSSVRQWLSSLDRLEALKPVLIVPSHGPTGDVALISGYRAYLTDIRDRTAAEKRAGRTADQAVEAVSAALPNYPDRGRLAGAIRAAYAEAP